jgi:hypothetical protein
MTRPGVYGDDMSDPLADDAVTERLLSGAGHEHDPALADFLALVRSIHVAAAPTRNFELDDFLAAPASTESRRRGRRSVLIARVAAAAAAAFAATGTLAVAHALPGPVQDLAAHLGVGRPAVDRPHAKPGTQPTPATDPTAGIIVPVGSPKAPSVPTADSSGERSGAVVGPKTSSPTVRPATTSTTLEGAPPAVLPGSTTGGDTPTTAGSGNGSATGSSNSSANGAANGNANGAANGNANGAANGNANGNANGAANGNANGAANGNPKGATNGKAKGH